MYSNLTIYSLLLVSMKKNITNFLFPLAQLVRSRRNCHLHTLSTPCRTRRSNRNRQKNTPKKMQKVGKRKIFSLITARRKNLFSPKSESLASFFWKNFHCSFNALWAISARRNDVIYLSADIPDQLMNFNDYEKLQFPWIAIICDCTPTIRPSTKMKTKAGCSV